MGNVLLTRGVFLVLLQDTHPPVEAVVGDGRSVVSAGAVVVYDPPPLPLHWGVAGPGSRRRAESGEAEGSRPNSGQEYKQQKVHVDHRTSQSPVSRQSGLHLLPLMLLLLLACAVKPDRNCFRSKLQNKIQHSSRKTKTKECKLIDTYTLKTNIPERDARQFNSNVSII